MIWLCEDWRGNKSKIKLMERELCEEVLPHCEGCVDLAQYSTVLFTKYGVLNTWGFFFFAAQRDKSLNL